MCMGVCAVHAQIYYIRYSFVIAAVAANTIAVHLFAQVILARFFLLLFNGNEYLTWIL